MKFIRLPDEASAYFIAPSSSSVVVGAVFESSMRTVQTQDNDNFANEHCQECVRYTTDDNDGGEVDDYAFRNQLKDALSDFSPYNACSQTDYENAINVLLEEVIQNYVSDNYDEDNTDDEDNVALKDLSAHDFTLSASFTISWSDICDSDSWSIDHSVSVSGRTDLGAGVEDEIDDLLDDEIDDKDREHYINSRGRDRIEDFYIDSESTARSDNLSTCSGGASIVKAGDCIQYGRDDLDDMLTSEGNEATIPRHAFMVSRESNSLNFKMAKISIDDDGEAKYYGFRCGNVHPNGNICWGASDTKIEFENFCGVYDSFWNSEFNTDLKGSIQTVNEFDKSDSYGNGYFYREEKAIFATKETAVGVLILSSYEFVEVINDSDFYPLEDDLMKSDENFFFLYKDMKTKSFFIKPNESLCYQAEDESQEEITLDRVTIPIEYLTK